MHKGLLTFVFLSAIFLSFYNLGVWAFQDFDEAIYARVFHESLSRGDFINFTFLNEPWIDKPPLYFWLAYLPASLIGESEFSLRLPSALLTIFSIVLIYKISLTLQGEALRSKTALISSLILLSTALFIFTGRQLRLDVPVSTSILFSYFAFLRAKEKKAWLIIFAGAVASGVLFKSVIGLLIFPIILIHSFVYKDFAWAKKSLFWTSLVFAFILIVPWHLTQFVEYGNIFWTRYFFNVGNRLAGEISLGQNPSILYQLFQFSLTTQPWFFVFILASLFYIFSKKTKFQTTSLLISTFLFTIFLFPKNRLIYYFVPSLPFIALFLASFFSSLIKKSKIATYTTLTILVTIGLINTGSKIFSPKDRNIFFQPVEKLSRYQIAEEEKQIGLKVSKASPCEAKCKLYLYRWQFYPTLIYYSQKADLYKLRTLNDLPPSGFLLVPRALLPSLTPLKKENIVYEGKSAVLFTLK